MEEPELEEGEACSYNNNNNDYDGSTDPDFDLAYIDEKIQDVLGHFQKDFEGGVSAENLGAKFGGYGSFLPTYQRSPVCSHTKTPPNTQNFSTPRSPNNLLGEHGYTASSFVPKTGRPGHASSSVTSLSASKALLSNDLAKQKTSMTSNQGETSTYRQESANKKSYVLNKQNSLKFRLKVGSDNLSTGKNAAIYSGLGLDVSPSSSPDNSPSESEGMYYEPQDFSFQSPTSILMVMTTLPLHRDLLLSPLSDDLIRFTEKEKVLKETKYVPVSWFAPESSHVMVNGSDFRKDDEKILKEKKIKSMERNNCSLETNTCDKKNVRDGANAVVKKEIETGISHPSATDTAKSSIKISDASEETSNSVVTGKVFVDVEKGFSGPTHKKEPGLDENPRTSSAGNVQEDKKISSLDGTADYSRKAGKYKGGKSSDSIKRNSNASKGKKTPKAKLDDSLKRQKASQGDTCDGQEGTKLLKERDSQLSGEKKKSKENQSSAVHETKKNVLAEYYATKQESSVDLKSQKDVRKTEDTYKDFFGDMVESEEEDDEGQKSSLKIKGARKSEKRTSAVSDAAERLISKKSDRVLMPESYLKAVPNVDLPSSSKPGSGALHANSNPVLIKDNGPKDNWVCCDKCGKWRLLPLGVSPDTLPDKWICTMLDWLPGKNNCIVPEDETTMAIRVLALEGQVIIQNNPVNTICQVNPEEDISKKRKKGLKEITSETDKEGPSTQALARYGSINHSHVVAKPDFRKSSDLHVERHKHKQKEKLKVADQHSDGGSSKSSKMKSKRDADQESFLLSKKMKTESFLFSDEDRVCEHGGDMRKGRPSSSSGVPATFAGKDKHTYNDHPMESQSDKKHRPQVFSKRPNGDGSLDMRNSEDTGAKRKRKLKESHETQVSKEELSENERKEKKARISEYEGKETSFSKGNAKPERKCMSHSKKDYGHAQNSVAATSSSSKISDSHKTKTSFHEAKGSPVESVSSSPIRISDPDKGASARRKKDESRETNFCATASLRRYSDGEDDGRSERSGIGKKDKQGFHDSSVLDFRDKDFSHSIGKTKEQVETSLDVENQNFGNGSAKDLPRKDQTHDEGRQNSDHWHRDGSRQRKSGKGSSSRSKDRKQSMRSDSKDDPRYVDKKKSVGKLPSESSKTESQTNFGGHENPDAKVDTLKPNIPKHCGGERNPKRILSEKCDKAETVSERETSLPPPPSRGVQDEISVQHSLPVSASNKVDKAGVFAESSQVDEVSKAPIQIQKNENLGNSLQNGHSPSPLRREPTSNQAASNALREAKDLKHMADRLKNTGSNLETIGLYFQAALKFLHGASLLESCSTENARHGDMVQSMHIYSTTAKLCGFCAHEYEKSKDMAAAALAYKCMEVAHMRVIYSSHSSANRYRHELQTALQMVPPGESPSSSASDVDNLNHPATADKAGTSRGANSPQVAGNHIISAQNRPNFQRLLQFAQDVCFAMDASRKSRIAFAAANENLGEAHCGESISSIKRALDYNFQDVEGLLRLVRLAVKAISR